ncbi:hypothetical protein V12G01_21123 [Vibrio alginolyticus 12G01]|uniref:hypothetical protein n=1 Tax=Vibrio alginolyticus TaxID=663 RepID=UPI0000D53838|nr:hypothetical protein [Vibrio alginolyticus]EAS76221.1 hypothetical protein V12G01_21123 [Vibrio alginolyticus 12G01]
MQYLKKVEVWFYGLFVGILAVQLGVSVGSLSIDIGVFSLNDIVIPKGELVALVALVLLGIGCLFINFACVRSAFNSTSESHKYVIGYVNKQVQAITKSNKDNVLNAKIIGWSKPVVDSGKWTSYKRGLENVIVPIPTELLLAVKIESFFIALYKSALQWLIPVVLTGGLVVKTVI